MASKPVHTEELRKAIDGLARTPDGRTLYLYLQKTLMGVPTGATTEWALQTHHGKRMFAAELMGLMAKGIEESDRHFGSRAIVFSVPGGVRIHGARQPAGARRVTHEHSVPGWDDNR